MNLNEHVIGRGWPPVNERHERLVEQIPCGTDIDAVVAAVKPFKDAGFTDVALVQIGGDQQQSFP